MSDDITDTLRDHYEGHDITVDGTVVEADVWTLYVKEVEPYRVELEIDYGTRELIPPPNCDGWDDLGLLLGAADEVLKIHLRDWSKTITEEARKIT